MVFLSICQFLTTIPSLHLSPSLTHSLPLLQKPTIVDYLDVLLCLIKADSLTHHMSYYLSESLLLYPKFGRFSPSFLAAACLLEARVLLGHDYPWSCDLMQATGLTVANLKSCCLMIYQLCLTDKYRITDSREVQLKAIVTRYVILCVCLH
ncbi:MAG: hypothetical protein MJE68_26800 [Proteobacteria bacterium]|nr:hypothetical protein [Pseudomonadota bacterium]